MRVRNLSLVVFWQSLAHAGSTSGVLSLPPSLYWDGVDGQWSTFFAQIGTPGQAVRLLPGTSATAGSSIWAVRPEGCSLANPSLQHCPDIRGQIFNPNDSSTWNIQKLQNGGLYSVPTYEESPLGYSANAYYGFDSIHLGMPSSDLPTLQNELIAGIGENTYVLGSLGLSSQPMNFTDFNSPIPSMLTNLKTQKQIGGLSWGYTAGAFYKDPPVFGSLTLGGYDSARTNSTITVPFGADFSRDLLIGIHSITTDSHGAEPLLSQGIYAFIDSMVSQMWLPISVCQNFEKAFNLNWDEPSSLYILSERQHQALLQQNPTFRFTLSASVDKLDSTLDIALPYSAFDLNISAPLVNSTMRYFPLQRAQNSTQFTLGRVFLQEAYVIADYNRHEFSLGQALFPPSGVESLKAIEPPGAGNSGYKMSTGAIAGIAVAVVCALASVAVFVWWIRRRENRKLSQQSNIMSADTPMEEYSQAFTARSTQEHFTSDRKELAEDTSAQRYEKKDIMEKDGIAVVSEMDEISHQVFEMPPSSAVYEKDGKIIVQEMEGSSAFHIAALDGSSVAR